MMPQKQGTFCMSWAKVWLNLPTVGKIPLSMDHATFMPLLICFKDVEATVNAMAQGCVTDEANPKLSPRQKLLLRLHYKLGHVGMQHLKFLLRVFKLFGAQGMMAANNEVVPPPCSSCVAGGMERKPIAPGLNKTTQDHTKRGSLKREQLIRGQKIFSDQFVSLTEKGRNYNNKGQQRSNLNYVGGTIFVDAATGYMSVKHQVSFTGGETSTSMLDFER